jgi:hypothetical protein
MEKLFGWITEKNHAISLLCFTLGALLLLLAVTTGIEIPGLRQLAPDANSRTVSLGLGAAFIVLALIVYFVPAQRTAGAPACLTQIGRVKLPKDDPSWQVFRHGTGPRKLTVYVPFDVAYSAKPRVSVSLSKIDIQDPKAHIHRIEVGADERDITPQGFVLFFATDLETMVYDAAASWVAVGICEEKRQR